MSEVITTPLQQVFVDYYNDPELSRTLKKDKINFVGGFGEPGQALAIVGEAPGQMENAKRQPFVGPAGVQLTKTLEKVGIDPFFTYTTNVVKYWPVDKRFKTRTPTDTEIELSTPYLRRELELVEPKIVALCGLSATKALFPDIKIMASVAGTLIEDKYVPVMHPATLLYLSKDFVEDRWDRYWAGYRALAGFLNDKK